MVARRRFSWAAVCLAGLTVAGVSAQQPLSPRNASYEIDVRFDPESKTLTGRQVLTWRNIQATATDELWFHLYWNGWLNSHSSWMRENRLRRRRGTPRKPREENWSYQQVDAVRLLPRESDGARLPATADAGGTDLTGTLRYAAPDDGNPDDRTVMVVDLPRPVAPGETVWVELEWRSKIPRTFARTGYRGDFYFIAHWFPKLGVFEPEGWNCHQFHAATEFYSDYGNYDVTITLPRRFVLGATGREDSRRENDDGTVSVRYLQPDVHGFAWTASPDFVEHRQQFEHPGLPPVEMRLLLQPEHRSQAERFFRATAAALEHYGTWYGAYPYGHITIVDPAWRSGAGGMEYPLLFTAGSRYLNPEGGGSPEGVTIHEAGHQFWYGVVGNNEQEHAWLDEGLTTYSTARVLEVVYGHEKYVKRYLDPPGSGLRGFLPVMFDDLLETREVHGNRIPGALRSTVNTADPQATPTFRYLPSEASNLSYGKTARWLMTLERHLGWDTLRRILATFYQRFRFRHPRPDDFFAVAAEVAGQDLDAFFDQVYRRSVIFDYAVDSVASFKAAPEGMIEGPDGFSYRPGGKGGNGEQPAYRSEVLVRRHGGGKFPVEVLLAFEDGSEIRHRWSGEERWKLFAEERPAKLEYAVVDPDRVLLLDLEYTNNSRLRENEEQAADKWAARWMFWLQDFLHTFTFYI